MNESEKEKLIGTMEAVLFTMGQAVGADVIASALEIPEEDVHVLADEYAKTLESDDRGIKLIRLDDAYQLCTKPELYGALIKVASVPKRPVMTEVMLEVLSIIGYRQPVTRSEIEHIRGVSSDYSVNKLIDLGLIEECGRQDSPGRPILFRTTEEFLRKFGLSSVHDLPPIREEFMEIVREMDLNSEMEGQLSFDLAMEEQECNGEETV